MKKADPAPEIPDGYPKSITEVYEMVKKAMLSDDKELIDKTWKFLCEAPGEWVWVKMKLITDCYQAADAEGKAEFCEMGMQDRIDEGSALALAMLFVDETTGIEYQEYLMGDGTIYRIPVVTTGMDKYAFDKALNKMFVGDFIKMHSASDVTYTLLDTQEKVDAYNEGIYDDKFVYKRESKKTL